ncbi:MAG: hypothetical protein QM530_09385 [Phycisphaerales bacterium]|nr:hypothetical protein [Phycisphaerales bacterium]
MKKIFLSTTSFLSLSFCLYLSSCAPKNSCDTLVCKNGGTCAADFCNCPTGYDGSQCENKISDRYIGTYFGWTRPRNGQNNHIDTADVYTNKDPLIVSVVMRRYPTVIYTGVIENKNNSIVVSDIVNGLLKSVVNITIKAPTAVDKKQVLNLNVVDYNNGNKITSLEFSGQKIVP